MTSVLALLLALGCFIVSYCTAGGEHPVHPEARLLTRVFFGGGLVLLGLGAWLAL